MTNLVKNLSICVIIFMIGISSFGCASKQNNTVTIQTEKKVHEVTYNYVDCGDLKLKKIGIQRELSNQHVGSYENQKIYTRNLILLDYKLREAESLLMCYKNQVEKQHELLSKK